MKFESLKKRDSSQITFNPDGTINLPSNIEKDLEKSQKHKEEFLDIWEDEEIDDNLHNVNDDVSGFNLYSNDKRLDVLKFSNGKTQEDVVNEVVEHIKDGRKVVFIKGVCGTGKSAIALNVGKALGKASIVVPGKSLQKQYRDDYSKDKYVLKEDHKRLKIKVITGRENHKCMFKLGKSANDSELPCKIEIKESNMSKIKEYLEMNPKVKDDLELKEVKRMSIAPVCPYWSPAVPSEIDLPMKSEKKNYKAVQGKNYTIHNRQAGCTYYGQFNSYIDNEVIVFNSMKYKLEMLMNRKPLTNVDVIDECDEFLDGFSNTRRINITRFFNSLLNVFPEGENMRFVLDKISSISSGMLSSNEVKDLYLSKDIKPFKETKLHELFRYLIDNPDLLDDVDDDSYFNYVYESALIFEDFFDEAFVSFTNEDRGLFVEIVTTNLAKKFGEMLDKIEALVLMSGTLHSENILRNVFGLDDFVIVDAETINQGQVEVRNTGVEFDCKYENFKNGKFSRRDYLFSLDKAVEVSEKPTLIHVNAFDDLPNEIEKAELGLVNLMTREKLIGLQKEDSEGMINRFKEGMTKTLFTTKCARGIDFPGDQCKSIVFTKYPNPHAKGVFWQILQKTHPAYYWDFYKDKAKREFLQKLYRGVRSRNDHIYVLSPDARILDAVKSLE